MSQPPLRYRLGFSHAAQHLVDVVLTAPTDGAPHLDLMMPVWTPGSYLVREFARHVEGVVARTGDGRLLAVEKTARNRWRVAPDGAAEVTLAWRVYCRDLSVRTSFVDADWALLNGASLFLTLADGTPREHRLELDLPAGWTTAVAPLERLSDDGPQAFAAPDFDALVDAPIVAGNPAVRRFDVSGREHLLVDVDADATWDGERATRELGAVVAALHRLWGEVPYPRYVVFNLFAEGYGGLEHRDSTVLLTSRWKARSRKGWLEWLSLAAHEIFHAWNVKRLRPAALGPFDYEREAYTPDLWVAEGITTYYDDLLVHRAGLSSRDEYLAALSESILRLQTTPGRLVQSLTGSSFDTWIKFYRPDENSVNTAVSYYVKGAVVAFLLDVRLRARTAGRASLDDVLRRAWGRFSGPTGFRPGEFQQLVAEVAGEPLDDFLEPALAGTGELDFAPALAWLGLRFAPSKPAPDPTAPPRGWLGAGVRLEDAKVTVYEVRRDGPAFAAGLNVGDEILAVGDHRVPPRGWEERLGMYPPGTAVSLLVARRERLRRIEVTLGAEPQPRWKLEIDPQADAAAQARLAAWLAG